MFEGEMLRKQLLLPCNTQRKVINNISDLFVSSTYEIIHRYASKLKLLIQLPPSSSEQQKPTEESNKTNQKSQQEGLQQNIKLRSKLNFENLKNLMICITHNRSKTHYGHKHVCLTHKCKVDRKHIDECSLLQSKFKPT